MLSLASNTIERRTIIVILTDKQEKKPLRFDLSLECLDSVETCHLKTGDYMVRFNDGYVPPICIERKSKTDLYGTLGRGMKRFKREIDRAILNGYRFYLFIECSQSEGDKPCVYSKNGKRMTVELPPGQLVRTLNTIEVEHGVIHKFYNNRTEMMLAIYRLFYAAGKHYIKDKKKLERELKSTSKSKQLLAE